MALLADGAGDKYKKDMKSLIKTVIVNNNSFDVVAKNSGNQTVKKILQDIMNDKNIEVMEIEGNKIYGRIHCQQDLAHSRADCPLPCE